MTLLPDPRAFDVGDFRECLGQRIATCVTLIGTKSDAASAAGITAEQLNKWIKGTVKVPVEALHMLALAADVSVVWLATGEGAGAFHPQRLPSIPSVRQHPASVSDGWWILPVLAAGVLFWGALLLFAF